MSCIKVLTLTTTYFVMSTHKLTYMYIIYWTLYNEKMRKKKRGGMTTILYKKSIHLINAGTKIIMLT